MRLWADLAKTGRKQKVWDVTRIAAMFCLLYDDNRWSNKQNIVIDSPAKSGHSVPTLSTTVEFGVLSKEQLKGLKPFTMNDDLLRLLAEVNFIYAEVSTCEEVLNFTKLAIDQLLLYIFIDVMLFFLCHCILLFNCMELNLNDGSSAIQLLKFSTRILGNISVFCLIVTLTQAINIKQGSILVFKLMSSLFLI